MLSLLVCFGMECLRPAVRGEWLTQFIDLKPGWNAVYLHVDPSHAALDESVANDESNPIEEVWLWETPVSSAQFILSPQTPTGSSSQWASWSRSAGAENVLQRLIANAAYLVRVRDDIASYTWAVQGKVVPPRNEWTSSGLNLIGFPTTLQNPATFEEFFEPAGSFLGDSEVYQYTGGPLGSGNPSRLFGFRTTPLRRGEAIWIRNPNTFARYFGPFEVKLRNSNGIHYGEDGSIATVRLRNTTPNPIVVYLQVVGSEAPPAGQTPILDSPSLLLRGELTRSWLFSADDIQNVSSLVNQLDRRSDAVSYYLADRFSADLIADFLANATPRESTQGIVDELNRIIQGPPNSLYEDSRTNGVGRFDGFLSQEAQSLLVQNPTGRDLVLLNRILLEDAFPLHIAKRRQDLASFTHPFSVLNSGTHFWTLQPSGQPGSEAEIILGPNRSAMTGSAGDRYAAILRFTDSLNLSQVDIPVSANVASAAGLWVGEAAITHVRHQLNADAQSGSGFNRTGPDGATVPSRSDTSLGPVARPFPLRLIVHNGGPGSEVFLLQRVYLGLGLDTNYDATTQERFLLKSELASARRISATHLPWTRENSPIPFDGEFQIGSGLTAEVAIGYSDTASNPFLHTYHPDHDNLDVAFKQSLPKGNESYDVSREIAMTFTAHGEDFASLTGSHHRVGGTYREVITMSGRPGESRSFEIQGVFSLTRITSTPMLTTH